MKISLKISPFFWLTAGLIGYLNSAGMPNPFLFTLIWIGVIFVSIMVHEWGHALTGYFFGQKPSIELTAFGGLTYPQGPELRGWREFLVVLNGPLFGFLLVVIASTLLGIGNFQNPYVLYTLKIFQWVNIFWTVINLLPVMPLDGGQLLRIVLESIWGAKGFKYTLFISMLLSAAFSVFFFSKGGLLIGAIFFLFAFQNFNTWKQKRIITESDRNKGLTSKLKEVEALLIKNGKSAAIPKLEELRTQSKKGLIFNLSTQYLAACKAEQKAYQAVYELLLPIKKRLTPESQLHLHHAAYEVGDYPLVMELSGACFQLIADPTIAIHSAEACAALNQKKPTIGWLQAARQAGFENLKATLSKEVFNSIRETKDFKQLQREL